MKAEQLSVFLENRAGRLAEVTHTLAEAGVNIRALSLADTSDFGILLLIVDDQEKAKSVLKEHSFTLGRTSVVAVQVPDTPGGLDSVLQFVSQHGINVEYMYAFITREADCAIMIFRFDKTDQAVDLLKGNGFTVLPPELTLMKLYMPLTADIYERNEWGDMPDEPELLTGRDLTAYEDHIRSALVKYRMPEEAARGIMHWYDTPDSVNDKVRSVTFNVERRDGRLWGIAECQISGELSAAELTTLKEYIEGQASDGWGEGFEQHEIAVGRGSELYVHLWQDYGWSIQTEQERFRAHFEKLPEMCFTLLSGTGQLICIKRGESGYYPSDWSTGDARENRRIADEQNRKRGVTPAQEEAMKIGSMCGWDVPGADPDNCEDIVQRRGGMELG